MKYTIDRIEDGIAVCEDENENLVKLSVCDLPDGIKEGDIIDGTDGGFAVLADETEHRRRKMAELQKSIFKKKK